MNLTLGHEDRRAVDLLLDRSAKAMGNGNGAAHTFFTPADPSMGERIIRAQRLLQLLNLLPGLEPPVDLATRTLRYVDNYSQHSSDIRPHLPNLMNTQHPHA
jgi:hypothetical protein